jgi:hypothetical protein
MSFLSWFLRPLPIPLKTEAQVRADFDIGEDRSGPWRCTLCDQMQPGTAPRVWVASSANFYEGRESYQSLVNGGKSGHRSGACMDCVRRYQ